MVAIPWCSAAAGVAKSTSSPRQLMVPPSGRCAPGEHLDQGGLAGAVLAEQAVHLAGPDIKVDPVQRPHAGELLHRVAHAQQWDVVHVASWIVMCVIAPGAKRTRVGVERGQVGLKTESETNRAAPTTPAVSPSSDSTIGRLPVASGSERR